MENLKELYKAILSVTLELENVINKNDFAKIDNLLEKRYTIIQEVLNVRSSSDISEELKQIIFKIQEIDNNNFKKLEDLKEDIAQEINSLTKNTKAVSAYKTKSIRSSRLVDETDI